MIFTFYDTVIIGTHIILEVQFIGVCAWLQDSVAKNLRTALFCVISQEEVVVEPESPVINYHYMVRNNPEERSSPFNWYPFWNLVENKITDKKAPFTFRKIWVYYCLTLHMNQNLFMKIKLCKLFFLHLVISTIKQWLESATELQITFQFVT
jgi:hypothetical protein